VATRHTYASSDDLRDYLAGTSFSSGWTSDAGSIRRILEASSRRIDLYCEGGTFGPLTETRYYDIGYGSLVQSPQYAVLAGTDAIATTVSLANVIPLNEDTSNTLDAGQQTLSILGSWGYTADTLSVTTADAIGSTTATSISVTSATDLGPAQTILIDSEQLYITAISGNTLTVQRGVNGTTAATHSGGAGLTRYDYPELVVQACLDIAKLTFRNRDLGAVGSIGAGEMSMTVAEGEVRSVLMTLEDFRVTGTSNGVIF
jgi:hypothetical protein